ncbi:alpha/beta hydrolase [Corynebacterium glutamicum]|uniref:alpha/beta hydrolase n=1 Tax=Corynebacterium TaxID=1716 RepID=UPI0008063885|nr:MULTISPECIES: alpha/beta hydrolase [Corynebacterium]ANR61145.1 esterase/lipase [[Brevibacterium] flavum ZL-1]ANR64145.1 esterase/lipase [Corynebacterium glutamicum ZL-6]ANU32415.1 esterase [Corynebacterium glutamicum]APT06159.1 esterase [Corynebacterium glutamicum]PST77330.1 esterase/lipase [Corynebacterium glutamicum ZL-2]
MLLHPDAQFYIDTLPILSAEEQVSFGKDAPVSEADATHVATDQDIAGVPVRVYTPLSGAGDLPCLVYFHGGGWSGGTLDMFDATVHSLVVGLPIIAISVDYRLAPAHPFPAAIDDAFAVVSAVLDGVSGLSIDTSRVAIGGDSAGGNIAAVTAQQLRERAVDSTPVLAHQVLIFPVTDVSTTDTPSYLTFGKDCYLTKEAMERYIEQYADGHDRTDPRLSPLLASDLSDLPPATIVYGECDVLAHEVRAYGQALLEAGNAVTMTEFKGQIHAFINLGGISADARAARRLIRAELEAALC